MATDCRWLEILSESLRIQPYFVRLDGSANESPYLPLSFMNTRLFGRFLVSLPYLNSGGCDRYTDDTAKQLIDKAVVLADELDVRYLELRHERHVAHKKLQHKMTDKVHMRLNLPSTTEQMWNSLKPKVRNQIRSGRKNDLTVEFGGLNLLSDFYEVFSQNMRDLGTPVYGRALFRTILRTFQEEAEICVVARNQRPVAAGLLIHGDSKTEIPSASSLRRLNRLNPNMLMYWHLICRAIERGQAVFDFGRSSVDSGTYRFKKQWGANAEPAVWQYYVRRGSFNDMRPENGQYDQLIRLWQRLPVWLTRLIGPYIVRGIP